MHKSHVTLKVGQIRKLNNFLRNWAFRTESDELYNLIMEAIIRTETGKAILKGTK